MHGLRQIQKQSPTVIPCSVLYNNPACLSIVCLCLFVVLCCVVKLTLGSASVLLFSGAASAFTGVAGTLPLGSVINRLRLSRAGRGSVLVTRNLKLKLNLL